MMLKHVSSPIKSARVSGPIGWFMPSLRVVSMSSLDPTPASSARIASLMNGIKRRFEMKPTQFCFMERQKACYSQKKNIRLWAYQGCRPIG